jgi:hypothetical protein
MFEYIVKFKLIEKYSLSENVVLLVDENCYKIPQFSELFELFNKTKRKVILYKEGKKYYVKNLYHFSPMNIIPPNFVNYKNIQSCDVLFNLETLDYLRFNLIPISSRKTFPKGFLYPEVKNLV